MTVSDIEKDFCLLFFSDETEQFRSPAEPEPGQVVTIRLRAPAAAGLSVRLVLDGTSEIPMHPAGETGADSPTRMYEAQFVCPDDSLYYCFRIEHMGRTYLYRKNGLKPAEPEEPAGPPFVFRLTPGFHTPEWSRGAVQYQIFPDRFRNGDPGNDVQDGEYSYNQKHVRKIQDWYAPPQEDDYRCFYGGDIAGILEKLDYLQGLGVEAIYLNPIFLSPSSHKYDTQDYDHIDPHLGVIEEDVDSPMQDWEYHNGFAQKYITRVLSKANTEKSDELFAGLCGELHRRGMKIILDGVFNHCGSFHRWMDREGIYRNKPGYAPGAYQDEASPYRDYFNFTEDSSGTDGPEGAAPGYEMWWGVETLPKLCYGQSRALWEEIFAIAEKWLRPPYRVDGWRLDVAADLGHTPEENHAFWKEFRYRVKAANPDAVIIAEHYGDASAWLCGDEWDSVMNYDAFMEPVTWFLTGMDKHSDTRRDDLYQDGEMFFRTMEETMDRFQWGSLQCAMNELSNHDHSRFLTRTNRTPGRLQSAGAEAASAGTEKAVLREAVVIQMTWPGAPTIYYGDEAGLAGWTDPDNRRGYPWGREDLELIEFHRALISLRREYPVLRSGSLLPLLGGPGRIAYARFDSGECLITACNNSAEDCSLSLDLRRTGLEDGTGFVRVFITDGNGFRREVTGAGSLEDGRLTVDLPPKSAVILAAVGRGMR